MSRKPLKPTRLAVALQVASLLAVAGGVFAMLISDITQHRADGARVEAASKLQLFALPHDSHANSR